jgi:hypothetical protein
MKYFLYYIIYEIRDNAGWTAEGSEHESRWRQEPSLLPVVQPDSGANPASYPMTLCWVTRQSLVDSEFGYSI